MLYVLLLRYEPEIFHNWIFLFTFAWLMNYNCSSLAILWWAAHVRTSRLGGWVKWKNSTEILVFSQRLVKLFNFPLIWILIPRQLWYSRDSWNPADFNSWLFYHPPKRKKANEKKAEEQQLTCVSESLTRVDGEFSRVFILLFSFPQRQQQSTAAAMLALAWREREKEEVKIKKRKVVKWWKLVRLSSL